MVTAVGSASSNASGRTRTRFAVARAERDLARADAVAGADRGELGHVAVGAQRGTGRGAAPAGAAACCGCWRSRGRSRSRRGTRDRPATAGCRTARDSGDGRAGRPGWLPMRFTTSAFWPGSTMRTAMSASRRRRSATSLDITSSIASAGMLSAQSGQDGRQHLDADHLAGRDPHRAAHRLAAGRGGAHQRRRGRCQHLGMGRELHRGLGRGEPAGERTNSSQPNACSSASTWRPTVGCVKPSERAAPDSEPSSSTAEKGLIEIPACDGGHT